ncbi:MAG: hypothetical protein WC082_11530 [Victivallales bacterium]
MSLDYNISQVKNWRRKLKSKNGKVVFETLLFTFYAIGVNRITEDAIGEIEERLIRYQRVFGPLLTRIAKNGKRVPVAITKNDLRKWLGMKTNISPMSDSAFDRHIRKLAKKQKAGITGGND